MQVKRFQFLILFSIILSSTISSVSFLDMEDTTLDMNSPIDTPSVAEMDLNIWNFTIDSGIADRFKAIFPAQSGGYYIVYTIHSEWSESNRNTSVMHIDEDGNQLWNRSLFNITSQTGTSGPADIIATQDGGFTILWTLYNISTFIQQVFLMHFDSGFYQLWNSTIYLDNSDQSFRQIIEASNLDYLLIGQTRFSNATQSFDVPYLMRTDGTGNQLWRKQYNTSVLNIPMVLVQSTSGKIVVACQTYLSHYYNIWVFSVDGSGNHLWNTTYDETDDDRPRDIELSSSGGFLVLGHTDDVPLLLHLDESGDITWNETYPSINPLDCNDLQVLADDSIAVLGQMDMDPDYPMWFMCLSPTGDMLWNMTIGSNDEYFGVTFLEISPGLFIFLADLPSWGAESVDYDAFAIKIAMPIVLYSPSEIIHEISTNLSYEVEYESPLGTDMWQINDTVNFMIDSSGFIHNATIPSVGIYAVEVQVNDTAGRSTNMEFSISVIDITGPQYQVESANPIAEYGFNFIYDIDAVDPSGISHYWLNDSRFMIDSMGIISNETALNINDYPLLISVNDTYDNIAEYTITILCRDTTNPEPQDVDNVNYEVGDPDFWITWSCFDYLPSTYQILLDGHLIEADIWDGSAVAYYVSDIELGTFNYTIIFEDTSGNQGYDSVLVNALDTTAPTINHPIDILYMEGITGNTINWSPADLHPFSYRIYHNDVEVQAGGWNGSSVSIPVDGLLVGPHNFTIIVYDSTGNSVTDTVLVTVSTSTTTSSSTTTSNTSGISQIINDLTNQVGMLSIGLVAVGAISVLSIIVIIYSIKRE